MNLTAEARALLHYPGDPPDTWTARAHPELEGQPLVHVFAGPSYRAPATPPPSGPYCPTHQES
jgi:hypothetical protein